MPTPTGCWWGIDAMPRYPWFRMWNEARTDEKLKCLTDAEFRVWFRLMCLASEQATERGTVPAMEPYLLAVEVAGGDEALLQQTLTKLIHLRIVDPTVPGGYLFANFEKRQYDKPSDRPEQTRERKQKSRVTGRDGGVTDDASRGVTPLSREVTLSHGQEERRGEERRGEVTPPISPPVGGEAPKSKKTTKAVHCAIPDDFTPTPQMVADACGKYGLTEPEVAAKTERFRRWAVAKHQTYVNWNMAWMNFMEPKSWDGPAAPGRGVDRRARATDHLDAVIRGEL